MQGVVLGELLFLTDVPSEVLKFMTLTCGAACMRVSNSHCQYSQLVLLPPLACCFMHVMYTCMLAMCIIMCWAIIAPTKRPLGHTVCHSVADLSLLSLLPRCTTSNLSKCVCSELACGDGICMCHPRGHVGHPCFTSKGSPSHAWTRTGVHATVI